MAHLGSRKPDRRSRRLAGLNPSDSATVAHVENAGALVNTRRRGGQNPSSGRCTRSSVRARAPSTSSLSSGEPGEPSNGIQVTGGAEGQSSGRNLQVGDVEAQGAEASTSSMASASSGSAPLLPSVGSGRDRRRRRRLGTRHRGALLRAYTEQLGAVPVRGESFCDCPQQTQSRDLQCTCGEEDSVFEWAWDVGTKSDASDLSDSGQDVKFHVNYSSGTAAVKGSQDMTDRQYFWEIKMTTPVYGTDMMVGVGTDSVDLDAFRYSFCSFLGRDGESWGLSYYGRAQHKGNFQPIAGARFGQGSIIGCHLDMWHGTLSFYKNRRPLGIAYTGLGGKTIFPMVSSTAARTGMKLIKSSSFSTSLQFMCCQLLRSIIPAHLDVMDALKFPPGLQAFLANNLSWLLRPNELAMEIPFSRKRRRACSEDESSDDLPTGRARKQARGLWAQLEDSELSSEDESDTTCTTDPDTTEQEIQS